MRLTTTMLSLVYISLMMMFTSCTGQEEPEKRIFEDERELYQNAEITVGAERLDEYLPLLNGMSIGLVVNQTSMVKDEHLVDVLLERKVNVKTIFAPEHGFRGTADAGEVVKDGKDVATGLPIVSLYGKNKQPTWEQLMDLDILIFDIQDVGARFYTYISTLHYVMEAAADFGKKVIVLDRPNPNGHYVDGPIMLQDNYSFVGMHTVPIVHGMTVGEYAKMMNNQNWFKEDMVCQLTVIPCDGYDHTKYYQLPIPPSPNLPNMHSIYLYPTLCLFEGTDISVGRGTDKQFQVVGSPNLADRRLSQEFYNMIPGYKFIPESKPGAKYPKHVGKECWGFNLSETSIKSLQQIDEIDYKYLQAIYQLHEDKPNFFNDFFIKLAGTNELRTLIENPEKTAEILVKWEAGIQEFKKIRKKYLLYKDFE